MFELRRKGRWVVGFGLTIHSLTILTTGAASAATATTRPAFNITTSPLPIALSVIPGGTITTDLRVQNSGTAPIKIKVGLLKFKASGDTGSPVLLKPQPSDTYIKWVTFSQNSFLAQPNVWNDIKMTINPPQEAAYGYYYAVIFSEDRAGQPAVTNKSNPLNGAVATLVLLNVQAPGEQRHLTVASFTASKKLYEYLPATFNIKVHNKGNIYVAPTGNIYISRDHKHDIAVLTVNSSQGNVLPDSSRNFQASWSDGFPVFANAQDHGQVISDKHGVPVKQLQWNFSKANKLRFGHYYAHLLLVYNDGKQDVPVEAEVSFWVIPYKLIIAFVVMLVGIYLLHRLSVRRAVQRQVNKLLNNNRAGPGNHHAS